MACSTSIDEMFSPPEMMMSLPRSRSSMLPSGCHGEVARVEPALAECLRRGLGIVEVARHDDVAPHHHLAHRLAVAGDVGHVLVDDADEIRRGVRLA